MLLNYILRKYTEAIKLQNPEKRLTMDDIKVKIEKKSGTRYK